MLSPNLLAWPGPTFLTAYLSAAVLLVVVYRLWRYRHQRGQPLTSTHDAGLTEPYAVAFLRAGAPEVLRLASFSLLQQGQLRQDDTQLLRTPHHQHTLPSHPLERSLWHRYRERPMPWHHLLRLDLPWVERLCAPYQQAQESAGLLIAPHSRARRRFRLLTWAMLALAAAKITYALWHGHSNVLYLVGAAILLAIGMAPPRGRLTQRGQHRLEDQQTLFRGLRQQIHQGKPVSSEDSLWLAAAFGLSVLPVAAYPAVGWLAYPTPIATGSTSADGGTGSSTSSCSSSGSHSSGNDGGSVGCGGCSSGGGGD